MTIRRFEHDDEFFGRAPSPDASPAAEHRGDPSGFGAEGAPLSPYTVVSVTDHGQETLIVKEKNGWWVPVGVETWWCESDEELAEKCLGYRVVSSPLREQRLREAVERLVAEFGESPGEPHTDTWIALEGALYPEDIHQVPETSSAARPHDLIRNCWCLPRTDGNVVAHRNPGDAE